MQQWEYMTELVSAHIKNKGWEEYRQTNWPNYKPHKFAPETMIPQLNKRGEGGWELVHMEPVVAGQNSDVCCFGTGTRWSNTYFCAWKRPKPEADAE
ncbi:unnamed protein product [marine sediment metagenome]|uniref:Uncharacterized protein n=1 Tax=marine sediment metagenome TaxID=412755 RepID=X0VB92_9ZZZZ